MNIEQLKKNIGWKFQLCPPAIGLSASPAWWRLSRVIEQSRLAEFHHVTGHVLLLGGDHIRSFMSDPNRDTAGQKHGFLELDVQVTVDRYNVRAEPISRHASSRQRTVSPSVRHSIIERLRRGPSRLAIASTHGDLEAHRFKQQLISIIREAGWFVDDRQTFMFAGVKTGIVITLPFHVLETPASKSVAEALAMTGNPIAANRGDMANESGIFIQVWHAP